MDPDGKLGCPFLNNTWSLQAAFLSVWVSIVYFPTSVLLLPADRNLTQRLCHIFDVSPHPCVKFSAVCKVGL